MCHTQTHEHHFTAPRLKSDPYDDMWTFAEDVDVEMMAWSVAATQSFQTPQLCLSGTHA